MSVSRTRKWCRNKTLQDSIRSLEAQVSGDLAKVSYTFDLAEIRLKSRKHGKWRLEGRRLPIGVG